jgi:hypothetical protein
MKYTLILFCAFVGTHSWATAFHPAYLSKLPLTASLKSLQRGMMPPKSGMPPLTTRECAKDSMVMSDVGKNTLDDRYQSIRGKMPSSLEQDFLHVPLRASQVPIIDFALKNKCVHSARHTRVTHTQTMSDHGLHDVSHA